VRPDSVVNIEATKTTALSTANDFLTLGLTVDDNTAHTSNVGGGIAFRGKRNTSGTQTVYGAIDGVKTGTSSDDYRGILRFFTNQNSTGVPLERMRIDSNGHILINRSSFSGSNPCKFFEIGTPSVEEKSGSNVTTTAYQ
jgi:hypothetical protein